MTQDSSREIKELRFSELHEVCAYGDSDRLEEMLKSGKYDHVNYKDPDWGERTALHWCCMKGKVDMARRLIDKGAHPGLRSSCGWTAAHYAAEAGRTNVLRTLHSLNSPMDRRDLFGDTPRRIAIVYGHKETAEFLRQAELEYRDKRTNSELSGDSEPYDDEDMEWCSNNNFIPDSFSSPEDLSIDGGSYSIKSNSESLDSSKRSLRKARHYGKTSSKSNDTKASKKSAKSARRGSKDSTETAKKSVGKTNKEQSPNKKGSPKSPQRRKGTLNRISESKSP